MGEDEIIGPGVAVTMSSTGQEMDARDPAALPPGSRVGSFIIECVLGSGGFGITYRARHETLNKQFALKEYFPRQFSYRRETMVQPTTSSGGEYSWGLDRFVKEAQALARFKHPAIVDVSDIFPANNTAYMVLAYEQAMSLSQWLERLGRRATQEELRHIIAPLLDALELVHSRDMLHRDIAPDNILVRADGTPVLIDFGAARDDLKHRAGPVTAVVKPGYSPPEQYQSAAEEQGPWSDIYGFGATLYYAVVGALPVAAEDRFDARIRTEAAKRARGLYGRGFLEAIDWAMEYRPEVRPQSVAEWRARLLSDDAAEIADGTAATRKLPEPSTVKGVWTAAIRRLRAWPMPGKVGTAVALAAILGVPFVMRPCELLGLGCSSEAPRPLLPPPLKLEIALPKKSYAIGDNLAFSVKSNRDCYFLIYTVSPTGVVEQHDPEENALFMGSPMLKADEWRHVPLQGFATVKPPAGDFELGAVCSTEPLASIGLNDAQLGGPARAGARSFSFALDNAAKGAKRDDFARAMVGYEVRQ